MLHPANLHVPCAPSARVVQPSSLHISPLLPPCLPHRPLAAVDGRGAFVERAGPKCAMFTANSSCYRRGAATFGRARHRPAVVFLALSSHTDGAVFGAQPRAILGEQPSTEQGLPPASCRVQECPHAAVNVVHHIHLARRVHMYHTRVERFHLPPHFYPNTNRVICHLFLGGWRKYERRRGRECTV